MKLLTIAIPSYNSQDYLNHAVESLLPGGDEVEILIVNDGSRDGTAKIADEYERKYPGIVRAIHKENGGHGDAVMTGIRNAAGKYYKVLDSDDWFDTEAFLRVLNRLKDLDAAGGSVDLLLSNYVYDKAGARHQYVVRYHPAGKRDLHLGGHPPLPGGPVYPDAFHHLPHRASAGVRAEAAEAHLLCR